MNSHFLQILSCDLTGYAVLLVLGIIILLKNCGGVSLNVQKLAHCTLFSLKVIGQVSFDIFN